MKILNQLAIILGLWALGEYISSFIQSVVVIPGSIIGMILLFILLKAKVIKLESINEVSNFFLDNMAIFFITIFVSTIIVMYISGKLVEIMINKRTKEN